MRCLVGLTLRQTATRTPAILMMLAGLGGLPESARAQAAAESTSSELDLQGPAPSPEPTSDAPSLEIGLDEVGVDIAPSPLRTTDGYTLEQTKLRIRRARIGLGVSGLALGAGVGMVLLAAAGSICISFGTPCTTPGWVGPVAGFGAVLTIGGIAGLIASSVLLRRRKRDRDYLSGARDGTLRRARWDLTRSRLVF